MTMMQQEVNYKRGDVVLVLFPNSDLKTTKLRLALVIQANNLKTDLPQLIVAMLTSRMFRANHPSRVAIQLDSDEGMQSGLLSDSVVMTDNLATILNAEIRRLTFIHPATLCYNYRHANTFIWFSLITDIVCRVGFGRAAFSRQ